MEKTSFELRNQATQERIAKALERIADALKEIGGDLDHRRHLHAVRALAKYYAEQRLAPTEEAQRTAAALVALRKAVKE